MVFSSLAFIFGFLPISLLGYWIFRKHVELQNVFLFVISILFYSLGEPRYVLLIIVTIIINYILALGVSTNRWLGRLAIGIDLLLLFIFKYNAWIINIINNQLQVRIPCLNLALPIGISFYTFQAISYVADVMQGKVKASRNIINVGLYISFFPQLIAGPIVRYGDINNQILFRKAAFEDVSEGAVRFMIGVAKKVLLADNMAVIVSKAFSLLSENNLSISFAWLGAVAYTFQIYYDFSGYSDMAIGLGGMFGLKIPENFNKPYIASSIRDFWRRWHISLSKWFRDYVYIPLGGNQKGNVRTYINIAIVWLLTGVWHGANWTFVIWGLVYGVFIMAEKLLSMEKRLQQHKYMAFFYRVFTVICIVLLWVVFRADNIDIAIRYIKTMFSFSTIRSGLNIFWMYLSEMKFELLICFLLSFICIPRWVKEKTIWGIGRNTLVVAAFLVSICYLVKGGFSPFLYFNF